MKLTESQLRRMIREEKKATKNYYGIVVAKMTRLEEMLDNAHDLIDDIRFRTQWGKDLKADFPDDYKDISDISTQIFEAYDGISNLREAIEPLADSEIRANRG